jgi:heme exporter protein C
MNSFWRWFYQWGTPHLVYQRTGAWLPYLAMISVVTLAMGLIWGVFFTPADYQQGDAFRIIYLHVPAAWMSMLIYFTMGVAAFVYLIWRVKMAYWALMSSVGVGAVFTLIALVTGAIWGKPMWGTWWVWDARLTSELILLFLYLGILALDAAFDEEEMAMSAVSILTLVGLVNLPVIHFSVIWWNTLHQGATVSVMRGASMDAQMLWPLLIVALATKVFFLWVVFLNLRARLLARHAQAAWVKNALCAPERTRA